MWINLEDSERELIKSHFQGTLLTQWQQLIEKITKAETPGPNDEAYRNAVETDDELEVDGDAVVSPGADPGAWVHAWIWVTDEQAGIEPEEEHEPDCPANDGFGCRCGEDQ